MKRVSLFCVIGVLFTGLFQGVDAQSSYVFHHLETKDGLSNNSVRSFLKDSYGFLWIGTEAGLNRYDGYGFKVYTMHPGMPNTLVSNIIDELQEDGFGNIWANSGYNYMLYDRDKDCFISDIKPFLQGLGIIAEQNCKVFVDKKRNLWVLNSKSIYYYNIKKKILSAFKSIIPVTAGLDLRVSDGGEFLYAMQWSGVCWQLNKHSGVQKIVKLPDSRRKDVRYNCVYADSHDGLWLYSYEDEEIFYREKPNRDWKNIKLKSDINAQSIVSIIAEEQNGQIWIGTDHKGLFIYNKERETITNVVYSPTKYTCLRSNNIRNIYMDDKGVVWIAHNKKGISFYHDSFLDFINVEHKECDDISAMIETQNGDVLLGTDGNGVYLKNHSTNDVKKLPIPNTAIVSMLEDRKGRVWIGTYLKGLFCYDRGKIVQYTTSNSRLSNNNIWNLKEDRYGNIWIGYLVGRIQKFHSESGDLGGLTTPLDDNPTVSEMYYDGGDKIYVGTGYGLLTIDIKTNRRVIYNGNARGTQRFNQQQISNVYKDERNILWLGSSDGLSAWDLKRDTIYNFTKSDGLCDNIIRAITEDNLKNIWITTSNGLSILTVSRDSKNELSISSRNYSKKDGLMSDYFNSHSICKLRNGDILLGATDGYMLFDPNRMSEKNQPLARVIFTGLTIGNQFIDVDSVYNGHKLLNRSIELTSKLYFNHNDKLVTLQFATRDLLNADKVKYVYKIEGFNNQWIQTQENKIVLTSLPAGEYRLLIKACNSDGVWNPEPTTLSIVVNPPFYYSVWAFIAYILLISCLSVYYVVRTQKRSRVKFEQQKKQMDQEQEIRLNEMKLKFFTNISHDLRTPLTLIITPLQIMLEDPKNEYLRKKLSTMYQNAQQLLTLINSLLDFRKIDAGAEALRLQSMDIVNLVKSIYSSFSVYANERNIEFSVFSEVESLAMPYDQDKMQKALTNLLSNAFKYTPDGGAVNIHLYRQNENVCISISDSGQGISDEEKQYVFERFYQAPQNPEKTGSGIGLHIANEYVKLHGGTIGLKNNEPSGSIFTIKLPIPEIEETEQSETIEEQIEELDGAKTALGNAAIKPKLLFVDDNNDFCEFMSDNLVDDYSVIIAHNGQEAIEQLKKVDIDIVVSDVMMPIMSGTELCKQIKTNIHWSHIPVILLTARTAEENKIEGFELGADDYITKPFNFNLLKLRIQKFMQWTEKSHKAFSQKLDVSPSEITITSLDEKLLEKAIKVVEAQMSDPEFSVEVLGDALGLSRGHLYKKLMVITGKGPAEFIRTIRLKRSRQLLEKSQLQVAEIAYEVGFGSPKRFTINFKEEFGVSPSEYSRLYKQQESK